jgi:hypothetical protein
MSRTALFAAMVADGIPEPKTAVIADELGLNGVEDLAELGTFDLLFADAEFRGRLIALRNAYKRDGDEAWPALGPALCGAFLATWGAQRE